MNIGGYFDYNATTPLSSSVKAAMVSALEQFENPSAIYASPEGAKRILDDARANVAALIGATPEQIIFTSGATESNNWVIRACLEEVSQAGAFVTSAIEHDATLASGKMICARTQREMRVVAPDATGIVQAQALGQACSGAVALVSVMLANNETGAVQPIAEIAKIAAQKDAFFHVDAVQAAGKMPIDVKALGCDSLSLSAHKFHGPKGVGVMYLKDPSRLSPMVVGGGQERGQRAGTENIVGIAGMGAACAEAHRDLSQRQDHVAHLRGALIEALQARHVHFVINGPVQRGDTIESTLNLSFPGIRAEALVMRLGLVHKIALSMGSACSTNKDRRHSHVLQAMDLDEQRLVSAIRISFGKYTTLEDIVTLADSLADALHMIKSIAAAE